ncbi:MAG: hypothetical protein RR363_05045, partial [Rikenellaceae bacterium]
ELSAPSAVITFNPHPRMVVGSQSSDPILITTLQEKIDILSRMGVDNLFIIEFTKEFAALSYEAFVKQYLVDTLKVKGVVMGYNHHFGKGREGSYEVLKSLGEKYEFAVSQVDCFSIDDYKISSTNIRKLLSEGNIERVNTLLIEPFSISGVLHNGVIINIDPLKVLPKEGRYSVCVNGVDTYLKINKNRVVTLDKYMDEGDVKIKFKSQ